MKKHPPKTSSFALQHSLFTQSLQNKIKPPKPNAHNTKSKLYPKTKHIKSFNTDHINQPYNDHSKKKKKQTEKEKEITIMIYYHQKGQCWRGKEEEQRRPEREGLKEGNGHEPVQSEAWFRCGEAHAEYHGDERE